MFQSFNHDHLIIAANFNFTCMVSWIQCRRLAFNVVEFDLFNVLVFYNVERFYTLHDELRRNLRNEKSSLRQDSPFFCLKMSFRTK